MNSAVLSPSEGLIARHLTHWIKVAVRGKGGSKDHLGRGWTYLAAWDIQERIAALDFVDLSIPTIYRSLKALISKGWFIREKLNAGRYRDQTYHYSFGTNHPELSNASDHGDKPDLIKAISSKLRVSPVVPPSNSRKTEDIRPSTTKQPDSLDRDREGSNPLQSITDAAPPALLDELKSIEANYRRRLREVKVTSEPSEAPRDLEPKKPIEPFTPMPSSHSGRSGGTWARIRALASQFDAGVVGRVSPKALITRDGQRLSVDDGATSPIR